LISCPPSIIIPLYYSEEFERTFLWQKTRSINRELQSNSWRRSRRSPTKNLEGIRVIAVAQKNQIHDIDHFGVDESIQKPKKWNIPGIKKFMASFGLWLAGLMIVYTVLAQVLKGIYMKTTNEWV